jgi:DNA-binding transcriptional LysR family regulator
MDRFLCIQAFVRVAEAQSFRSAARQLDVTPSVVTSRIKQLEKFVQTPLLHRSTRKVTLSEAGVNFLGECNDLMERMNSMTDRMRLAQGSPSGVLRLEVLPGFALGHLGRALKEFNGAYPQLDLDITVSDQPVNPVDEGYDVSLQLFRPDAGQLIERPLFPVRRVFCASPAYLKRRAAPKQPEDLLKHDMGLYSSYPTRNRWTFRRDDKETTLELPARIRTNSVHLLRDFARSGAGVTCLPTLVCGDDLMTGALVPLLTDFEMPALALIALYPTTQRRSVKVKLFVDFIKKRFSGEPEWDRALRQLPAFKTD